jgi:hypothetical protein
MVTVQWFGYGVEFASEAAVCSSCTLECALVSLEVSQAPPEHGKILNELERDFITLIFSKKRYASYAPPSTYVWWPPTIAQ